MPGPTPVPIDTTLDSILEALPAKAVSGERLAEFSERERRRQTLKRLAVLAGQLGERYSPDRARLENYKLYHPRQREVLARLTALRDRLAEFVAAGRGLVLFGTVGTGKDHLLAALLYAAAEAGFDAAWVNGQEFYGRFRDAIDEGRPESGLLARWEAPAVLGISDPIPPTRAPSDRNIELLYRLTDRRYHRLRSTWISLNAASPEDADRKLSAPVFDRLREAAVLVPCFWPSWRERPNPPAG